ncbi:bile acid:sodium symporter [Williamsia sp. 1138]|uniref:bile acid:sodium symporter family protein n=1 Tax=Williamsia sp. 1138 TaxID=1903117 RepID=UPI000A0FA753|nr:bile acid:sodium symporter family protein [Williamsia sp. 1138]OZG28887.1 bile acid:sodium symporter [Williamsia sp. 1138]
MKDSALISIGLPIALAIIMCGLGLSLTPGDFVRVLRSPRAVVIALVLQILILPAIAFGLAVAFELPPLIAVGIMLLAASPGGTTANLLSHLFGGDVALNVTLTAVNSVLAVVTIPVVTNLAIDHFDSGGTLGLQFAKIVQVIAIVLIPVLIGMAIRHVAPAFAARADKPVRIFSIAVLFVVTVGALISERENALDCVRQAGGAVTLFCALSLTIGYLGARLLRLDDRQAIATSMEVGVHNTTVALTIALSVLDSIDVAIPIAVYSIVMYPLAAIFGWVVTRTSSGDDQGMPTATASHGGAAAPRR